MNFIFEDLENCTNFIKCPDVNRSGIRRFTTSPMTQSIVFNGRFSMFGLRSFNRIAFNKEKMPEHYIITTAVNHHPNDWASTSCFSQLNETYLKDLQEGRAMILFDQSFEGYQTSWLWEYFHEDCKKYNIPPQALIYTTGNMLCAEQYKSWADEKNITDRMTAIPYSHFEPDVNGMAKDLKLDISFKKQIKYKTSNVDKIKTYNCLQKRLRAHRIWFYIYLYKANLLDDGLVSMNKYDSSAGYFEGQFLPSELVDAANDKLPLLVYGKNNNEYDDNYYIRRIVDQVYLDTWVSVISDASFGDQDGTLFLSEKVYKPIACFHPFIIMGNKGSLKKLREMGYRTFDGFIDESYDELPTFERFDAIIEAIKKINAIEDKLSWFKGMEEILIHNRKVLNSNAAKFNPAYAELENCYKGYFNV